LVAIIATAGLMGLVAVPSISEGTSARVHSRISAPLVDAAIRAHVAAATAVSDHDVEVVHNGLGVAFPCGPTAQIDVWAAPSETYRRHVHFRLRGTEAGQPCADLRVRAEVVVWQQMVVARAPVRAGEAIPLTTARVRRDEVVGDPVDPAGGPYLAVAPMPAGVPVIMSRVRSVPDRKAGERVTLVAGSQGLMIRANGRLLSDARVGDTVRVANPATGSVVVGVLADDGQVIAQGAE
jgi:flagella basal body P-ring formation protein FlgA